MKLAKVKMGEYCDYRIIIDEIVQWNDDLFISGRTCLHSGLFKIKESMNTEKYEYEVSEDRPYYSESGPNWGMDFLTKYKLG